MLAPVATLLLALAMAAPETPPVAPVATSAVPAVHVDRLGYPPAAPKLAMVVAEPAAERFGVYRLADGEEMLAGELTTPVLDRDSGDRVQIADLSPLPPGRYELRVPGPEKDSLAGVAEVTVAADPYSGLLRSALRAFYGLRCGTAVDLAPDDPGYAHPPCHLDAGFHPSSGRADGPAPTGGWHDAGDYGRYVVNSGIATGTLLLAWEIYGERLAGLDLGIPESNDGTPDLLDEVRWNLEWMLGMQDADGGAWHKQTPPDFPAFVMPHEDGSENLVIGTGRAPFKSSCATADLAAVAAIAGRVYRPHDARFADRALAAARRAWGWIGAHPEVHFANPPGVATGEYGDDDCGDERLWAAVEIWRTGGDVAAGAHVEAEAQRALAAIDDTSPPSWRDVGALAAWSYLLGASGDAATLVAIRRRTLTAADAVAGRARSHPYRLPMTDADWIWGSNAVAANYGLQLLIAYEIEPDRRYLDAALDVVHHLLGRNTFSLSWVTGTGLHSVHRPHHRPSGADGVEAPWPGLLAGGPNAARQDPVLRTLPEGTPPARTWADQEASYAGNEVAINWNAPLVFLLAGVSAAQR